MGGQRWVVRGGGIQKRVQEKKLRTATIASQSSKAELPSSNYSFDQMKAAASSTDSQDIKLLFMGSALFFLALSVLCYMNRSYLIQLMHTCWTGWKYIHASIMNA